MCPRKWLIISKKIKVTNFSLTQPLINIGKIQLFFFSFSNYYYFSVTKKLLLLIRAGWELSTEWHWRPGQLTNTNHELTKYIHYFFKNNFDFNGRLFIERGWNRPILQPQLCGCVAERGKGGKGEKTDKNNWSRKCRTPVWKRIEGAKGLEREERKRNCFTNSHFIFSEMLNNDAIHYQIIKLICKKDLLE